MNDKQTSARLRNHALGKHDLEHGYPRRDCLECQKAGSVSLEYATSADHAAVSAAVMKRITAPGGSNAST